MGVLIVTIAVGLAACYSPSLRDCTVTCSAASDCASGQVCGGDHFCAAPVIAGTCATPVQLDADIDGALADAAIDARAADAAIDAALFVALHLHVDGKGTLLLDGGGSCRSDCMLSVPRAEPSTLRAIADADQMFDRWTSPTCAGQPATCTFTPLVATTVNARFRKEAQ